MSRRQLQLSAGNGVAKSARPWPGALVIAAGICLAALTAPTSSAAEAFAPETQAPIRSAFTTVITRARPDVILSNESTYTAWTIANRRALIRAQPSKASRPVFKLSFWTPDGFTQSYILLREHWNGSQAWVELRIPRRPNGRVGWVPRNALAGFRVTHLHIVVDRETRRLTLYRRGVVIFRAPVGVGKPSTPTPAGRFWITEAFPSSVPAYGPYAFGTSDYSVLSDWPGGGIIGLHGTDQPQLVPGDPSHGCIRLHNADIVALSHLIGMGTPLRIT